MNETLTTLKQNVAALAAEYKAAVDAKREDANEVFRRYHVAGSRLDAAIVAAYKHCRQAFAHQRPTWGDQFLGKD